MPAPDNVDDMLRWSLTPGQKPPSFRRRCDDIRLKRERGATALPPNPPGATPPPPLEPEADPLWKRFLESRATAVAKDQASQIADLETHLAFANFGLSDARSRGDEHNQKKFVDEVIKFSKALKDEKLAADRLGLESGELLPRSTVELLLAAHAYWTMRTTDLALDSLSRRLVNLSFPEEARAILEPELLRARFLAAYTRATQVATRSALPAWAVEKIRDTVDDYIEHGAEHFDQEMQPNAFAHPASPSPCAAPEFTAGDGI